MCDRNVCCEDHGVNMTRDWTALLADAVEIQLLHKGNNMDREAILVAIQTEAVRRMEKLLFRHDFPTTPGDTPWDKMRHLLADILREALDVLEHPTPAEPKPMQECTCEE